MRPAGKTFTLIPGNKVQHPFCHNHSGKRVMGLSCNSMGGHSPMSLQPSNVLLFS